MIESPLNDARNPALGISPTNKKGRKMKRRKSVRGFIHKEFKDYYNRTCRLYESSCIVPQVWLGIVSETHKDELGKPEIDSMLLDKKLAKALVIELNYFIKTGKLR